MRTGRINSVGVLVAAVLVVGTVLLWRFVASCHGETGLKDTSRGVPVPASPVIRTPFEPVKILVDNSFKLERRGEPVSVGIPLKQGSSVVDTESLCLTDLSGKIIPAQFRILARWGALEDPRRPIKWVLADFQADAPANGTGVYFLARGSQPKLTPLAVRENAREITVDTGKVSFTVGKEGKGLFRELVLTGGPSAIGKDGYTGFMLTRKGEKFLGTVESITIEECGPLKVTLCVKGFFTNSKGVKFCGGDARYLPNDKGKPLPENKPLSYSARMYAYRNKGLMRIDYTLENNGTGINPYYPSNDVFIDGSYFQVTPTPSKAILSGTSFAEYATLSDTFVLRQGYQLIDKVNDRNNFSFAATLNERTLVSGVRSDGWVDVTTGPVGMALGLRYFWQNAPKSIEYEKGVVSIGFLPEKGAVPESDPKLTHSASGNYFFSGGWHKTHEFALFLHDETSRGDTGKALLGLTTPLIVHCEPEWYAATEAWGRITPAGEKLPGEIGEAVARYDLYQRMFVHPTATTPDINQLREERFLGASHYGWENFGDLAWGGGLFSALHYDWPYIMWLQFLRSGDGAFYGMAQQMTEHSADLDQIHSPGPKNAPSLYHDGLWQWEQIGYLGGHHKTLQMAGYLVSHTWNGGYALGYLLTGNRRYLEAAERGAQAGIRYWEHVFSGAKQVFTQNRSQGWTIQMMVNLYRITGDSKLLRDAMAIFTNTLLYTEQLATPPGSGGKGYILNSDGTIKDKVIVTFAAYPLGPLCDLHYEAEKAGIDVKDLEGYLVRNLRWLKEYAFVGGETSWDGLYSLLTISYATDPLNPNNNGGGTLAHNILFADAFGYGSIMLKERDPQLSREFFLFGRHLFRDLMLYRTVDKKDKNSRINPDRHAPVSWGWLPTATKELGYIGRSGQQYLWAEKLNIVQQQNLK
jgi:hypothetical protein